MKHRSNMNFWFLLSALLCVSLWTKSTALDPEEPLFLSKYIENNTTEDGRRAAEVMPFLEGIKSYSGLFTVDAAKQSHMFFWYFPSENKQKTAPLIVWLNGYSTPSTYGVFLQTGPYRFENGELKRMDISWQKYYHMLHIDNPVGVGYSYTKSSDGYSNNIDEIANNLFSTLSQFFKFFPELVANDLFLSGTSTAGKYVPALAYKIYKHNKNATNKFQLKGLFLGNPFLDASQISYGEYLYEHGFVDFKEKLGLDEKEKTIMKFLKEKDYNTFYNKVKDYLILKNSSYILNVTGLNNRFDYCEKTINQSSFKEFIQKPEIKKELHIGNLSFDNGDLAMKHFAQPYAFSVKRWLEKMLNEIKMVFYNGERDITWAYPMMTKVLSSLQWNGADGYRTASRIKLLNATDLTGYMKGYSNLTDVFIRNAGHSAISNQPLLVLQLLHNFTEYE